jgi:hypothetical protein
MRSTTPSVIAGIAPQRAANGLGRDGFQRATHAGLNQGAVGIVKVDARHGSVASGCDHEAKAIATFYGSEG